VRARDRDELFSEVCRIAIEAGEFCLAWIGIADRTAGVITPVASAGGLANFFDLTPASTLDMEPGGIGLAGCAIHTMKPKVSSHLLDHPDPAMREEMARRNINSKAVFPLIAGNEAVGVLALYATDAEAFDKEEMQLLGELARDIGFALEHIRKAQKLERITRVNALLSGINGAIVRIRTRQELYAEACRIAVETGGLPFAWLGVVDEAGMQLRPVACAGGDNGYLHLIRDRLSLRDDAPGGNGLVARAVLEGRALIVSDISVGSAVKHKQALVDRGTRSIAALPLIVAGKAVGAFELHAAQVGFFDADEMNLLVELAANIAFALEHIEKEEKVQRLTRVYAVLSGINALIVRVSDRDELFKGACRIAVEEGGFRLAWIGVVDRQAMQIVPVTAAGEEAGFLDGVQDRLSIRDRLPAGDDVVAGYGATATAVRENRAIVVNDVLNDPRVKHRKQHSDRGIRAMVSLPLLIANEAVAVFDLHAAEAEFFDEAEMALLRDLAGNIAFAIDHIDRQERLNNFAYYDQLTGLANRNLFVERTAQFMRDAVSGGHRLALFFIDLDRFRNINDSLGRQAGDELLRQVADWLSSNVGVPNLLARVGPDQFAVVLPHVSKQGSVARLLEKRIQAFVDHTFRLNDAAIRMTIRVGAAMFPNDAIDAPTLLQNAEAAMKRAKQIDDRCVFYTRNMTDVVSGKLSLENQLRQALENEEFVLHYQPKILIDGGKLSGAEALIRWNNPRTGLVLPGEFISILEETGLIHEVGRWALKQASADFLRWRAAGLPAVRIAVNVSPLQLRSHGFVADIRKLTQSDPHAASGLELEITESMIMADVEHNIATLQQIRALGVGIAIDDFGTGFSSLGYLSRLPIDTLKIDRSFVSEMTVTQGGLALVSTIVSLAHSLKLNVVAEGVETEEELRLLRLLRCDEMQGFLLSRPVPAGMFEAGFLSGAVHR